MPPLHRLCHHLTQSVLQRHSSGTYTTAHSLNRYIWWPHCAAWRPGTTSVTCANVIRVRVRPESSTRMMRRGKLRVEDAEVLRTSGDLSTCMFSRGREPLTTYCDDIQGDYLMRCWSSRGPRPRSGKRSFVLVTIVVPKGTGVSGRDRGANAGGGGDVSGYLGRARLWRHRALRAAAILIHKKVFNGCQNRFSQWQNG